MPSAPASGTAWSRRWARATNTCGTTARSSRKTPATFLTGRSSHAPTADLRERSDDGRSGAGGGRLLRGGRVRHYPQGVPLAQAGLRRATELLRDARDRLRLRQGRARVNTRLRTLRSRQEAGGGMTGDVAEKDVAMFVKFIEGN